LKVVVVNDDPDDDAVEALIAELSDDRLSLYRPMAKRGAAENFNLAFADKDAAYGSILEDDNWWDPTFVGEMVAALSKHPDAHIAIGNERIWEETPDGKWIDTGQLIWGRFDTRLHGFTAEEICGSAKLCNSAMLFRLPECRAFATPPSIPVDVTEHFRERLLVSQPVLLGRPLVNYAVTRTTARSSQGSTWGVFQCLLIGSLFAAVGDRQGCARLARRLWESCGTATSPRATTLALTGIFVREARELVWQAPLVTKLRVLGWAIKRPDQVPAFSACRKAHHNEFDFLTSAPLTRRLANSFQQGAA
jgi:hypothetical protein